MGASTAQPLDQLRRIESRRLRLVGRGVIREASPGRYYLDAPSLADRMATRRRVAAIAVLIMTAGLLLTLALALGAASSFK